MYRVIKLSKYLSLSFYGADTSVLFSLLGSDLFYSVKKWSLLAVKKLLETYEAYSVGEDRGNIVSKALSISESSYLFSYFLSPSR